MTMQRTSPTAGDHARAAALRGVVRQLWQRQVHPEREGLATLVVGASAYELQQWSNHGHISYWMPMAEAKDGSRTYLHMAREAMAGLKGKLDGASRAPLEKRPGKNGQRRTDFAQAKLQTLSEFARYYETACDIPSRLCTAPTLYDLDREVTLLVMLDSAYNYGPQQWLDLFAWTGATIATGVSMLPMELLFPDLPHNFGYTYVEYQDHGDGFSQR